MLAQAAILLCIRLHVNQKDGGRVEGPKQQLMQTEPCTM